MHCLKHCKGWANSSVSGTHPVVSLELIQMYWGFPDRAGAFWQSASFRPEVSVKAGRCRTASLSSLLFNMSASFSPMVWTTPVNKPMSSCMQEPCHIPKTASHMTLPHSLAPSSSHPLPAACRGEGWWRCSIHAWVPTLSILGTLVGYGSVHRTSLSVLRTFYDRSWEQHKPMDENINIYKALWQHDHLANHQ